MDKSFKTFKDRIQAGFDNNEESLQRFGKFFSNQLKVYLIESNNLNILNKNNPFGEWVGLDSPGWYVNRHDNDEINNTFYININDKRIWKLFSLNEAVRSDNLVEGWVKGNLGLDYCWLTRGLLMRWGNNNNWKEMGIGVRFEDGLTPEENRGHLSLKAWHGASDKIQGLKEILLAVSDKYAINSVRWQKTNAGSVTISEEWYSNGKVTINRAVDVDEALYSVSEMANHYSDSIKTITEARNKKPTAFEFEFSEKVDLEKFKNVVKKGTGSMRLWLVETERDDGYIRFSGVDMHTWDRVLLGINEDFAHLVVPGKGCVNAVPRIATLQGEDNAGKTSISFDGVDIFA